MNIEKIISTAKNAAYRAAEIILSHADNIQVDFKSVNDLVTQADIQAQKAIISLIHKEYPDHDFLGEESDVTASLDADHLWIIDPLDGTNNFANGIPQFSISIAYAEKGVLIAGVVFDPSKNEMFYAGKSMGSFLNGKQIFVSSKNPINQAIVCTGFYYDRGALMKRTLKAIEVLFTNNIRGIRRMGSAAIDLCWVANGRFDAYFEYQLNVWDFAAGLLILIEAGGVAFDTDGSAMNLSAKGVICSNHKLHKSFFELVKY